MCSWRPLYILLRQRQDPPSSHQKIIHTNSITLPQLNIRQDPPPLGQRVVLIEHFDLANVQGPPPGLQVGLCWISQFGTQNNLIKRATPEDQDSTDHVLEEAICRRRI